MTTKPNKLVGERCRGSNPRDRATTMTVEYPEWKSNFKRKKAKVKLEIYEELMNEHDEDIVYSAMMEILNKDVKKWLLDSYKRRNIDNED